MKLNIKKKGFMGICLAAVLVAGAFSVHSLQAAERVDVSATVTITAELEDTIAAHYDEVKVDLYKIGNVEPTGDISLDERYENSGIDLTVLDEKGVTVDMVKESIVEKALSKVTPDNGDKQIIISTAGGNNKGSVEIPGGAGIYLYVPQRVTNERYAYEFTPYVLFAPTSEYIMTGNGSDKWDYKPVIKLKGQEVQRTGKLRIIKKLDNFNASLGKQSFVYKVTGTLDGTKVLDNVYSLDFTNSGTVDRILDEDIPVGTIVTVKEEYAGSCYRAVGDVQISDIEIKPFEVETDQPAEALFENTYSGGLISGGIAAENKFVEDSDGIHWEDQSVDVER